jgi:hypothetical protein
MENNHGPASPARAAWVPATSAGRPVVRISAASGRSLEAVARPVALRVVLGHALRADGRHGGVRQLSNQ